MSCGTVYFQTLKKIGRLIWCFFQTLGSTQEFEINLRGLEQSLAAQRESEPQWDGGMKGLR